MSDRSLIDPSDMWGAVRGLPSQILTSWSAAQAATPPLAASEQILLIGMGGSAIAGDLAASLWVERLNRPVTVLRGGLLPAWVGPQTLAIVSSYSGDTAETLQAYADTGARGAARVAITCGGDLAARALADAVPVIPLVGGGQPRAAIGQGLTAVLAVLTASGAVEGVEPDLIHAAAAMTDLLAADAHHATSHSTIPHSTSDSTAGDAAGGTPRAAGDATLTVMPSSIAAAMKGLLPIIYVPASLGPVGRRWKTQMNENAKLTASWEEIPELDHNAVAGYAGPGGARKETVLVGLRAPSAGADASLRLSVSLALAAEEGWHTLEIAAPASTLVTEGLWLVAYGDLVSLHLAALQGIDPSPVEMISRLKATLRARA